MAGNAAYAVKDYDGEVGTVAWNTDPIAPDGSNYTAIVVANGVLWAAILDVIRATSANKIQLSNIIRGSNSPSTDPEAQREDKWFVQYQDTTQWLDAPTNTIPNPGYNKLFNLEIPCADLSLRENNSEVVYTQAGGGVDPLFDTLVTAFNSVVRSPYGGAAQVLEIRSVGRNT